MHSVIFRHEGFDRTYKADNYIDALVLFHSLSGKFTVVELWQGAKLITKHDNT
jgi:hypothetical protein